MRTRIALFALLFAAAASAREYHVSVQGDDAHSGSKRRPFRTIAAAAQVAQPGDVITVHEGIYRERVAPPRGGTSDKRRITYQAAPGEKVVITGSEPVKGWQPVTNDTWKVVIPSAFFGAFNPYSDLIRGDWFDPKGRSHHTGAVYLNGDWLVEAAKLEEVLQPAGKQPLWFGVADNADPAGYLVNIAWLKPGDGGRIPAVQTSGKRGTRPAACSEGGQCVGFIRARDWLRYDGVDFGTGAEELELRVAAEAAAALIEVRLDRVDGALLGSAPVRPTGDWQKWVTVPVKIKPTSGRQTICLVITTPRAATDRTTIWAQFPGVNPNAADVEINVRPTVFTPEKTGINYLTVRGFVVRRAATNWAPPTAGQIGLVSAYWCKGWIIESNDIGYSTCSGIALGKYGDEYDNTSADSPEGYVATIQRALTNGWDRDAVGGHLVRNNRIHHCEQAGVVGSLGCSFSTVTGNEIHDIHVRQLFGGAEMAAIKFHGAIDVVIAGNHIYRGCRGIWLDWMGQGAQITGNLLHDNGPQEDLFLEVNHGPQLVANNLLLSPLAVNVQSQGAAFAHNWIGGNFFLWMYDGRQTPFHPAHSTALAGMHDNPSGDDRFYNNVFSARGHLSAYDGAVLPVQMAGNVFLEGARPSKWEKTPVRAPDFKANLQLVEKPDGWYLELTLDPAWGTAQPRPLVTTDLLGKAKIPSLPFENADGTPLRLATDYFGRPRNERQPFPGPFELPGGGRQSLKVWPRPRQP